MLVTQELVQRCTSAPQPQRHGPVNRSPLSAAGEYRRTETPPYPSAPPDLPAIRTLSGQGDTRPKYRLLAAGGVNVNRRTSSTPHSVALPATKIRHLGSEGVLRLRFVILQGTGTKRTGRTLSDSNAAE